MFPKSLRINTKKSPHPWKITGNFTKKQYITENPRKLEKAAQKIAQKNKRKPEKLQYQSSREQLYLYKTENNAQNKKIYAQTSRAEKSHQNVTSREVRLGGEDALELLEADRAATILVHLFVDSRVG